MTSECDLLAETYARITTITSTLSEDDLQRPTRCSGWSVADLIFHLLLDAQRALVTFASPGSGTPDVDRASYWAPHKPAAPWAAEHEEFVRRSVAAHSSPRIVVHRWEETAAAAVHAAAATELDALLRTQGHVLTAADFTSTLIIEGALHHLDLVVELPDAPPPSTVVLAHVRAVLDDILGVSAPANWPDADYALAAGGRVVVPEDVAAALGEHAERFPLLG
jgi:uncharacterized protein (TIGR03083 family)